MIRAFCNRAPPKHGHGTGQPTGTMQHLAGDPNFGLTSTDPQGRGAALRYAAKIYDYATSPTAQDHRVEAIELLPAPRGHGSAGALTASLTGILA